MTYVARFVRKLLRQRKAFPLERCTNRFIIKQMLLVIIKLLFLLIMKTLYVCRILLLVQSFSFALKSPLKTKSLAQIEFCTLFHNADMFPWHRMYGFLNSCTSHDMSNDVLCHVFRKCCPLSTYIRRHFNVSASNWMTNLKLNRIMLISCVLSHVHANYSTTKLMTSNKLHTRCDVKHM